MNALGRFLAQFSMWLWKMFGDSHVIMNTSLSCNSSLLLITKNIYYYE